MPVDQFGTVFLEVNGNLIDQVRYFGTADLEKHVTRLKAEWMLDHFKSEYLFYTMAQSRMNTENISTL